MSWLAPVRTYSDQMVLTDSTPSESVMDFSQPFSVLNEKLKPPPSTSEQIYSSLNRLENRQMASHRNKCSPYRSSILSSDTELKDNDGDDLTSSGSDDISSSDLPPATTCLLNELNLKDFDDDSSSTKSDEKDCPEEMSSENGTGAPEDESPFQRSYMEKCLPDLIRSGRPLGRRRTVGHVSQTLKEVRREVELSRRRSIKLKAQVDKLQEKKDGPGWSHDRERVTEEVLSVLRLLHPLTEPHYIQPEPSDGSNRLDSALDNLQKVARNLAVGHTAKQEFTPGNKGIEESAILQQALRDRDDAIEKKKAMEAELLRSKTEMMVLNNQVLEAAQRRLEMSLELEAWKEDFQLLLHQQVLAQQQAEQAQKKTSRLGLLRRSNRPPIQRPSNFPLPPAATTTPGSRSPRSPASPVNTAPGSPTSGSAKPNWRDKLKRGKTTSRNADQDAESDCGRHDDGFQVISLD